MNLSMWVERHARSRPEAVAVAEGERPHAIWRDFAARIAAVAGGLRALGLVPGDRVAIVMRNRVEYLTAQFGAWHAGMVAVLVNARLHREEIAYILEHSGAKVVVTDADHAEDVAAVAANAASLRIVVAPGTDWDRLLAASPITAADRAPTDPAWLFYTSGTTGRPKGATITNRNLLTMSLSYFADIDEIAPTDTVLHAAPLSHGSGLYGLPHVMRGATSVIPDSGDGEEVVRLLARWTGVSFFAAPQMVRRLAESPAVRAADLTNLKTDRKSTRLNSSHVSEFRMPSSA